MKYCKDCKHFRWKNRGDQAECHREPPRMIVSPVYGLIPAHQPLCVSLRVSDGECGPEARFFEPKMFVWQDAESTEAHKGTAGDGGSMKVLRLKPNIHVTNVSE